MDKKSYFEKTLSSNVIDISLFKKICYTGIPEEYRGISYLILLGVLPLNTFNFTAEMAKKKKMYELKRLFYNRNVSSSKELEKIKHQIDIDVLRINKDYRTSQQNDISYIYRNILLLTAFKKPFIGYAQGMADLIVPFSNMFSSLKSNTVNNTNFEFLSFESTEFISYYCVNSLLHRIQHNIYDLQGSPLKKVEIIVERADPQLYQHLKDSSLEMHMFCFRWFSCLFIREFEIETWYRIFDSMLSTEITEFIPFFGAALLLFYKDTVLKNDFATNILFMQNLNKENVTIENIEQMLGNVSYLQTLFNV